MLEKGNECVIIFVLQENFSAMTRLDQNRAAGQIAEKVNLIFWPNFVSVYLLRVCMYTYVVGADPLERTGIGGVRERNEGKFHKSCLYETQITNTNLFSQYSV